MLCILHLILILVSPSGPIKIGHTNVITYSNRPFSDVTEMNETLISNWNSTVKKDDIIYHLGDFAFSTKPELFFDRLNGRKHLIIGNHDRRPTLALSWLSKNSLYELKLNRQTFILCHYAMRVWNKSHYGTINLYGHSHGSLPGIGKQLDVGVDCWNYFPVSVDEILQKLNHDK